MKILIVVDMQNDFIDGTLGTAEAISILPQVQRKINLYRTLGFPILFTRDTHTQNYMDTQEGQNLPVPHCIQNTPGWEISSALEVANSTIINKPSFGSTDLAKYIRENYKDAEIELVGLCTDICVISNALLLKAYFPENKIRVDSSCCAGVTPQSHKNALDAMQMCQIIIE